MNENTQTATVPFTAYEYVTVSAKHDDAPLYTDCYRSFGWQQTEGRYPSLTSPGSVTMKMKRDRKLPHRSELNTLQHQCERALESIRALEQRKSTRAFTAAMVIGLVGTAFLALAVFNVVYFALGIPLTAVFGALGFIGWGAGYLVYTKVQQNTTARVAPLIDEQYDVVYGTCEAANALLAG